MLIGYMRVSKSDGSHTLDLQRDALLAAGVAPERLYEDLASGRKDARPGLAACLKALQPGHALVVWKLDRLGRDLKHLVSVADELQQRHVGFKVLAGAGAQIDTTTANGRLVFGISLNLSDFVARTNWWRCAVSPCHCSVHRLQRPEVEQAVQRLVPQHTRPFVYTFEVSNPGHRRGARRSRTALRWSGLVRDGPSGYGVQRRRWGHGVRRRVGSVSGPAAATAQQGRAAVRALGSGVVSRGCAAGAAPYPGIRA